MNLYGFHISLGEKNRRIGNIATTWLYHYN
jgi:hypothetical protein